MHDYHSPELPVRRPLPPLRLSPRYFGSILIHNSLAAVNFFLGCVGVIQVGRIINYRRSLDGSTTEAIKDAEKEVVDSAKATVAKVEAAVEKVEKK